MSSLMRTAIYVRFLQFSCCCCTDVCIGSSILSVSFSPSLLPLRLFFLYFFFFLHFTFSLYLRSLAPLFSSILTQTSTATERELCSFLLQKHHSLRATTALFSFPSLGKWSSVALQALQVVEAVDVCSDV